MPAQMAVEKALARIGGKPRDEKGARRVRLAAFVADMGEAVRAVRVVRVRGQGLLDFRAGPQRAAHPRIAPWHGRKGTKNRHRNAGRGCPSAPRSGASVRCGRSRRSSRWGSRPLATTKASRGHAVRCVYNAEMAASARPAHSQLEECDVAGLALGQTRGRVLCRRQARSAPARRCLPASSTWAFPA